MKELSKHLVIPTQIVQEVSRQKIMGQLKPKKGQTCYEYDLSTKTFKVAEFDDVVSDLDGNVANILKMKKGCLYAVALNPRNADRRFIKMIKELIDNHKTI